MWYFSDEPPRKTANRKDPVSVACRADIGFTNKETPFKFKNSNLVACIVVECGGELLDFRRIA